MARTPCYCIRSLRCQRGSLQPCHSDISSLLDNQNTGTHFCAFTRLVPGPQGSQPVLLAVGFTFVRALVAFFACLDKLNITFACFEYQFVNNLCRNLRSLFYLVPDLARKSSIIRTRRSYQWDRVRSNSAQLCNDCPGSRTLYL